MTQTKKVDQQRVNVALSRAADRLCLMRTVGLKDLNPADLKARIIEHFHDPMPAGHKVIGDDPLARCDSGFEREVLSMLMDANDRARSQVKAGSFSIDLVVEDAEDRRLAIELDGDAFHGPDVWEREMARQAVLERAGWVFWRTLAIDLDRRGVRSSVRPSLAAHLTAGVDRMDARYQRSEARAKRDLFPCRPLDI